MVPEMWSWKYTTRNNSLYLEADGIDGREKRCLKSFTIF